MKRFNLAKAEGYSKLAPPHLFLNLSFSLFLIFVCCAGELRAQSEGSGCGNRATLPIDSEQFQERLQRINDYKEKYINREKTDPPIVAIPVVVHILYECDSRCPDYRPMGCNAYRVTNQEVENAIELLNRNFRAQNSQINTVPSYFQSAIGVSDIQFCLATRDPEGNFTTGIERTPTNTCYYAFQDNDVVNESSGGLSVWDSERYLNIWVVPNIDGYKGYAFYPWDNSDKDGVVIARRFFQDNSGATLTHEIGHYLGLYHTFDENALGSCSDDDGIADTPIQEDGHYSNQEVTCFSYPHISCNNGPNGDMNTNFMNVSTCRHFFTNDQCRAMEATLEPSGERPGLLTSLACRRPVHNIKPGQFGGNVYNITWDPSEWPDAVRRYEVRWRYVNLCKYFPWQYPPGSLIWGTTPGITLQFNYGQKVEIQVRDLGDPSWSASHIIITGSGGGTPDSFYEPNNNSVSTAPDIGQGSDLSISGPCGYSYWPVPTHDPDIYRFYNSGNIKLSIYTSNDGNGTPSFVVESASNAWQQYYPSRERGNINLATNVESINLDAAGVPRGYCLVTITGNGYYTFRKEQCELIGLVDEPYLTPKNMRITEEEEGVTLPIKCYPNPTSDILSLEGLDESQQYLLELFSLDGRKIAEKETAGLGTHFMDISSQEEGMYCLRCKSKSGSVAFMVSKISR